MEKDYYKVFSDRNRKYSNGFSAAVQNDAKRNFDAFLQSSPDAIDVTINDSEKVIKVGTILEKESETENIRHFLSQIEDHLQVGDFIHWRDTTWLIYTKMLDTIEAYDKFEAIKCSHTLSWISEDGVLNTVPVYLLAQTDEKIKSNFRTWNNMITPQPNKFMRVITTRRNITLGQKFLVDGTAWYVVESDYISVPNILYLSLTEDKVDTYLDDIEKNVANIIDLNKITISVEDTIKVSVGRRYIINAHAELNGNTYNEELSYEVVEGSNNILLDKNIVEGIEEGSSSIKISLKSNPEIYTIVKVITANDMPDTTLFYIKGDTILKWGRSKVYSFCRSVNGIERAINVNFTIENNQQALVKVENLSPNLLLTANKDNKVGTIILKVLYNGQLYSKEIKIVSLWM